MASLDKKPASVAPEAEKIEIDRSKYETVTDAAALESALRELLEKPDIARAMGDAGYQAVVRRQGGVRATLELVSRYLAGGEGMSKDG